jgi:O-antigen ligase
VAVGVLYFLLKEKKMYVAVVLGLALIIVLYVSALSSQRLYAVDLLLITMFLIFICICNKGIQRRNKIVGFVAIFLVWCLSLLLVHNSAGASAPKRLLNTVLGVNELYNDRVGADLNLDDVIERYDDVGMERIKHINETFDSLKDRAKKSVLSGVISGTGQVHSGSHNFILDLISGSGFLGALSYFLLLFGAFWKIIRPCFNKNTFYQLSFIILLFLMAGAGSMVNSPLTQPYYFLNLLFVAWFIASDFQTKEI